MSKTQIERLLFIQAYKDSLGVEGAEKLIQDTTQSIGVPNRTFFDKQEALQICEALAKKQGFVGIIAKLLIARITIR